MRLHGSLGIGYSGEKHEGEQKIRENKRKSIIARGYPTRAVLCASRPRCSLCITRRATGSPRRRTQRRRRPRRRPGRRQHSRLVLRLICDLRAGTSLISTLSASPRRHSTILSFPPHEPPLRLYLIRGRCYNLPFPLSVSALETFAVLLLEIHSFACTC